MAINKDVNYKVNVDKGREAGVDSLNRAKQAADKFEDSLSDATRQAGKLDKAVDGAGSNVNFGRAGGGVERVLGGLGAGEASNLIGLAGDIGDVVESLGSGGLKGVMSSLISPIGLVSAGIAGVTLAVTLLNAEYERQKKIATDYLNYVVSAAQTEESLQQKLRDGGTAALEELRKAQNDQLALITAGNEAARAEIERAQQIMDDITRGLRSNDDNAFQQARIDIEVAQETLRKFNDETKALQPSVDALTTVMHSAEFEAAKFAETFGVVLKSGLSGVVSVVNRANDALGTFTDTMEDAKKASDAASAAAQKAFTDLQTTVQATVDKLDSDQKTLGAALRDTIADLNSELVAAQKEAQADILAAQAEYNASRQAEEATFAKEQTRAEEDYRRELARIRRDSRADERQAIQENDIAALLRVREERRAQVQDTRQAFNAEKQRRAEDFADRRAVEEAALAARIADIQRASAAEMAAITAEIAAEQAAYDATIAEITRIRDAEIERVRNVALANRERYEAEEEAVDAVTTKWEALVSYIDGKLYQLTPGLKTSPQQPGIGVLPLPDPFGIGGFFGASGTGASGGATQAGSGGVNINLGGVQLGEIATPSSVNAALIQLTQLFAQAFQQARGVA